MKLFRLAVAFPFIIILSMTMMTRSYATPVSALVENNLDGSQKLLGHVPSVVKNGNATFKYHALASETLNIRIILPLQNQSQLSTLLKGLYDPKSPNYHQFLTPKQFAQQFGPSSINIQEIKEFLNKEGITVTGQTENGAILNAVGPVSAFEQTFGLNINYYQEADGTRFFAPDADPTISPTLAGKILAIGGLNNIAKYHPNYKKVSLKPITNTPSGPGFGGMGAVKSSFGTGPGGYLAPSDIKTAYNLNSVPATGAGQNVALFELDGYTPSDITTYDAQFSLPGVPLQNILIDGFNGAPDCTLGDTTCTDEGSAEVTLDIELVTAFAPGSSNILVYEAPGTEQGWIDEWTKIASDDLAKVISCSWYELGSDSDSPTINSDNEVFQEMAAQGQAIFVAAGDEGAYCNGGNGTLCVNEPGSQPFVTSVGISALTTNSNGTFNSETASVYGGGGVSGYFPIPSYQTMAASQAVNAANVSKTMRNIPDVVLTADASTAYAFYIDGNWGGFYGSSLASPVWASFVSCLNQWLGTSGPLGFANPQLYQIAQSTSSYANDFHDITTGNNGFIFTGGGYPAKTGFDDATGLGSFNGLNLFNDVIDRITVIPSLPTGLEAIGGFAQVVLSWDPSVGAASYNIKRATASGGPYTTIAASVANPSYIDNSASNATTYYYVVSAVNSAGESANSSQVSATPSALLPRTPIGLTASIAGNTKVVLMWSVSTGAASYNIKRSNVNGGPYTTIASAVTNTYTDTSVSMAATYYYVVSAVNSAGETPNSTQVSAALPSPPLTPTNFAAVPILGYEGATPIPGDDVYLTWNPSGGATSYNIKRAAVSGGPYVTIGTATQKTYPFYNDEAVTSGTTYYYVVSAVNAIGESPNSLQASATPIAAPLPPVMIATAGNAQVVLSWTATTNAVSYVLVRGTTIDGGAYPIIPGTTTTSTTYTDTSVSNGTTYYYWVQAMNVYQMESVLSAAASATPVAPPSAPSGFNATAGNAQVTLSWSVSSGATSYNVERSTVSGGPYTTIASPVTTTYIDTALINGTPYYYVVTAVNAGGQSANSLQVSATPKGLPMAPTTVSATAGQAQATVSFSGALSNGSAITSYTVTSSPGGLTASGASSPITVTGLTNGTAYTFTVTATNGVGTSTASSASNSVTPLAPPLAPTGLSAIAGNNQVALSWNVSAGATSYNVGRSTISGGPYTTINATSTTSYTDTTADIQGTTYYYVVSAVNYGGESANSTQASAMPLVPPPSVPTGLSAWGASSTSINLSWVASTDSFGVVSGYNIYRNGVLVAKSTTTNYTDTGLSPATTYTYTVSAYDGAGNTSAQSTSSTALTPPAAPTGLVATSGNSQIVLTWNASHGATSYKVNRETLGGTWSVIATVTAITYTDASVTNGKPYYYMVVAYDGNVASSDSAVVNAVSHSTPPTPPPPPPPPLPTPPSPPPRN